MPRAGGFAVADLTTLETRLSAARAANLDNLDVLLSSIKLSKGLLEKAAVFYRTGVLAQETYDYVLEVEGAGYLTGVWVAIGATPSPQKADVIIEIDGVEVPPFEHHAEDFGNVGGSVNAVCFLTTWDATYKYVLMCTPLYRFDASLKVGLYNNNTAGTTIVAHGNITYLLEP